MWFNMVFTDLFTDLLIQFCIKVKDVADHGFRFGLLRMTYIVISKKYCQIDNWHLDLQDVTRRVKLVSFLDRW